MKRWKELGKFLLYKYLDGNVKNELGEVTHPDYPEAWYRTVAAATGDRLKTAKLEAERAEEEARKKKIQQVGDSVLTLLNARGIAVDDPTKEKVRAAEKLDQVERWLVRAATAGSIAEVFEEK